MKRAVVIGAGLAGLCAANRLLEQGHPVTLISKGPGGLQLSQGTIDVLGYAPHRVKNPVAELSQLPTDHPYRILGDKRVRHAVNWLGDVLNLAGNPQENFQLPTTVGALRPTALVPQSFTAADARLVSSYAVVGIRQIKDFPADLIAGNLARTGYEGRKITAESAWVDFDARAGEPDSSNVHYAAALDDPDLLEVLAAKIAALAPPGEVVLVPAVVGLKNPNAWSHFTQVLGRPVAEIATQPPNVAGIRMFNALLDRARSIGLRHIQGALATDFQTEGDQVVAIKVNSAGRCTVVRCSHVIYAPGGFESGALSVDSYGHIKERLFGLTLTADDVSGLLDPDYWAPQPLFSVGVRTDDVMRPLAGERPNYANLHVAGGILAGAQRSQEKSGDAIAIASALCAADAVLGGER